MRDTIKSLKNFLYKYYLGKSIIGLISNIRFLLNIFFFKLNKFLRICFGNQKYEKLTKLKNKYINERCFIVATGPSMKMKYLKYLKNEYTFSMNNITKYYAKTKWRPTFYVIQDLEALEENIVRIKKEKNSKIFINYKIHKKIKNDKNKILYPHYNGLHSSRMDKKFITNKFSKDASIEVFDGYTVTYSIIQIAHYLGFKKIYLIGVDNNFKNPKINDLNFFRNIKNKKEYLEDYKTWDKRMLIAYKCAKKWSKKLDFEIISINNSKLNIFRKKKFSSLIKKN